MFHWSDILGALTFHQQAYSYISDRVHWLFTSGISSYCLSSLIFFSIIYELTDGGGLLPPSTPSVHVTFHGWQQHNRFWNAFPAGKTRQTVKSSAGRHTSEERRKLANLSLEGGVTGENLRVQRLRNVREQMGGGQIVRLQEIRRYILQERMGSL